MIKHRKDGEEHASFINQIQYLFCNISLQRIFSLHYANDFSSAFSIVSPNEVSAITLPPFVLIVPLSIFCSSMENNTFLYLFNSCNFFSFFVSFWVSARNKHYCCCYFISNLQILFAKSPIPNSLQ